MLSAGTSNNPRGWSLRGEQLMQMKHHKDVNQAPFLRIDTLCLTVLNRLSFVSKKQTMTLE